MDQIFGTIERITYMSDENQFTVAKLKQPRKADFTTIVGQLPRITPGEVVRLLGRWKRDPSHGMQFIVEKYAVETPSDVVGIEKYLASGMIRGIGPTYAKRIVKRFKEKTLDVIEKEPKKLLEIEGIGTKRFETIKTSWKEHRAMREVMLFLQKYGISPSFAHKVYRLYGESTVERVQENPYTLATEIRGIGFKTADEMASRMGFPKDAEMRLESGALYVLSELASEGHTCYAVPSFLERAEELLGAGVESRLEALTEQSRIVIEEEKIWLKGLYLAEKGIARELKRLSENASRLREVDTEKAAVWAEGQLALELAPKQKEAVKTALREKVLVITGGPGTGKSTITNAILKVTERLTQKIVLAAPTGRAAKRMSEITGREASTIHALLQYNFSKGGFRKNRDDPLVCDWIVVDEASMLDTSLAYYLLRALPDHARLLLIGDIHQLPSVGPGAVLQDIIDSETYPTAQLTEIYRQARGSKIITNAHLINQGEFPDLSFDKESDFFFLKKEEPSDIKEKIVELITGWLPKKYRLHPIRDIQVLSPMKKGGVGIEALNDVLQEKLNPGQPYLSYSGLKFSMKDKVMQIRNNYSKEVYNGDIGQITYVDEEARELAVRFDDKHVTYTLAELEELQIAYATSVHKYQGSEAPCVIIPIHSSHFMMLKRNLLYTAVTRGKKLVILIGTGKAVGIAINSQDARLRETGLKQALQHSRNSSPDTVNVRTS